MAKFCGSKNNNIDVEDALTNKSKTKDSATKRMQKILDSKSYDEDKVNLEKFTNDYGKATGDPRYERNSKGSRRGPYTEDDISKHGGSFYKLFDKNGNRIASLNEEGIVLRK